MRNALALILLLVAGAATAQPEPPPPPPITAIRLTSPVDVDGILDEPVWHAAPPETLFLQSDPVEWAPPTERTEVRVAYDDDALYIGAVLFDTAPDSILSRLARRDTDIAGDRFTVYLDSQHDRRSGYYFAVISGGTLLDGTLSNDGASDNSWDCVWQGKTHRDDRGWTVEMRIPFSQLRFASGAQPVWGINFSRIIQRRNEKLYVVHQPRNGSGFNSRFPDLLGLRDLHPARNVSLLPYVTSKAEFARHSALDPFHDGKQMDGNVGGDLRASVGSRLTLNATVNPDFGQVEVDPAVVNLSDAETYFNEKRPFFVEGISNFRFGNEGSNSYWNFNWPEPTFFYSRRIGRAPQGSVPDVPFADVPVGTTILGAAKLTGKLTPTWNFGTLHAITGREQARLFDGSVRSNIDVEPLTYYGIARGLHEFKDRRFGLGLLGSSVIRRIDDPSLRDQLNGQAFVTGVDGWAFLDPKKMWVVSGYSAMSYLHGTRADITAIQQNSRHYFQRPDVHYVSVDTNATSLTGAVTRLWLNKQEGRSFMNAGFGFVNPGFDANDLGFSRSSDLYNGHIAGGYRWTEPTRLTKSKDIATAVFGSWDFGGVANWLGTFLNGDVEFCNNYSWSYEAAYNPRTVNDRATRGGPRILNLPGYELSTYFDTDGKRPMFYFVNLYTYLQPEARAWNWSASPGVTLTPASNVRVSVGPGLARSKDTSGFVDIYADPTAAATYGHRYVFATLDQTQVSADVRLDWSFTPGLSLQLYAQPLVSTGHYYDYKELAAPHSYDFRVYGTGGSTYDPSTVTADPDGAGPAAPIGIGNRDFTIRSMRGNAVLRWEYLPGSTFYLVWTQSREADDEANQFHFGPAMSRLASVHPDNIFLAKVTWFFAP